MNVGGGVILDQTPFTAGAVWLAGTHISSELRCTGTQLTGTDEDGNALVANGITVNGDLTLDGGFTAAGTVSLRSAHVGGSLNLKPSRLAASDRKAFDAAGAQITHDLVWEPGQPVSGLVILEDAEAGRLKDNWRGRANGYWPSTREGQLRLDGFTYNRIREEDGITWVERLEWIGSPRKPAPRGMLTAAG